MSSNAKEFRPTASLEMLRIRADVLLAFRAFFAAEGYWEVETPLLSHETIIDAHLQPVAVQREGRPPLFLQTSPELGMKRLLAAGADSIFQISRAFRAGEQGDRHNLEFTMVEWYRVGNSYHDQMTFTERAVQAVVKVALESPSFEIACARVNRSRCLRYFSHEFERVRYDDAFECFAGEHVLGRSAPELARIAARHGLAVPESLAEDDVDGWLNLLFVELVEPHLGRDRPTFVYDYPATQAALARVRPDEPPVAERFELYLRGIEVCNGYQELTDAQEIRKRFKHQQTLREQAGWPSLPMPKRFLAAHEAGLPYCAGVALGLDRLMMAIAAADSLAEVMAFPFDQA
ncbi:MAG: EF-P lysine aminoacylase GenX [Planctomycetes bacterium]|nr:EF-P lysine aminoacylase GenX [Planctomycetota bacterium]